MSVCFPICVSPCLCVLIAGLLVGPPVLAAQFAGGTGDPNDPYQIATAEHLLSIGADWDLVGKHYVLTNDIDLDPNLPGRRIFNHAVIGDATPARAEFGGSFSGGGHIIRNLVIVSEGSNPIGLFASLARGARVEQLGIENARVSGTTTVGILAGQNRGTIAACYSTGTVRCRSLPRDSTGETGSGANDVLTEMMAIYGRRYVPQELDPGRRTRVLTRAGGLVGVNDSRIECCYSFAGVEAVSDDPNAVAAGGLAGTSHGRIFASYAAGRVSGGAGGLTGANSNEPFLPKPAMGQIFLCFWDVQTSGASRSGAGAGRMTEQMMDRETFKGWDYGGFWTIADGVDYPRLRWERRAAEPMPTFGAYVDGTGEPDDPFVIRTGDQLVKVSLFRSAWDCHLVLGDDIDMGPVDPNDYVPIGDLYYPFTGCFDGRGHTIHNFTWRTDDASHSGLFGLLGHRIAWRAPEGLIENVRIRGGAVSGGNRVGLLAGESWGMMRNCHVEGTVTATDSYVGGLVGFSGGCFEDCSSSGQVTGREAVGGLVGRIGLGKANVIDSCRSSCTVTGQKAVGGLAGAAAGQIRDSYATGDVKGVANVGGLIGDAAARVRACYATGNVEGEKHVGGLVGLSLSSAVACYASGKVAGREGVGGLVGFNCGSVVASYSTGKVVGLEAFGGVIGSQNVLLVSDMRAGDELLCFWDQQASGVPVSDGGLGKTTAQLMQAATFKGWGLDDVWVLDEGQDYPRLAWQRLPGKAIRDDPNHYAGGVGTPDDPFQIRTVAQLCAISNYPGDFDAHFVLTQDLDFADLDGHAFVPIGMKRFPFTGSFDGQGHTISRLTIAEPNENHIGLFGNVGLTPFEIENSTTRIADLHLRDVHVQGCEQVGGLAGMIGRATVANCTVTGRVRAEGPVGGLIGWSCADITRCQANVEVKGEGHVGGLVGQNHGHVEESAAVGYVNGGKRVGGLIGLNATEETGSMDEDCGSKAGGRVVRSFADCVVTGLEEVGGLVGYSGGCSRIESCYARGTVTGQKEVGGLIGACIRSFIADSYAAAAVSAEDTSGSFCGANWDRQYIAHDRYNPGRVSSCFWDIDVAGLSSGFGDSPDPNGLHGLPTARMRTAAPYIDAGWDFDAVWTVREGQDYPRLRWEEP